MVQPCYVPRGDRLLDISSTEIYFSSPSVPLQFMRASFSRASLHRNMRHHRRNESQPRRTESLNCHLPSCIVEPLWHYPLYRDNGGYPTDCGSETPILSAKGCFCALFRHNQGCKSNAHLGQKSVGQILVFCTLDRIEQTVNIQGGCRWISGTASK